MRHVSFVVIFLGLSQFLLAQKVDINFDVSFKGEKIGTLHATEQKSGSHLTKDIKTVTDTKVITMSIHVESEVNITHKDGNLVNGTAYRHANRGSEDVHARITRINDTSYEVERNGKKEMIKNVKIDFCVIDLFFREPKGIKTIFSNMHARMLEIKNMGPGRYLVVTPDDKDSIYIYHNGKLITVESDTPVGKVISKRTSP